MPNNGIKSDGKKPPRLMPGVIFWRYLVKKLEWKCHAPNLLGEVLNNDQCAPLKVPINILARLLLQVAKRASQLNDTELNKLMCRLTLYEIADPESKGYDKEKLKQLLNEGEI